MRKTIDGIEVIEIPFGAFKRLPSNAGIYVHNYYTRKVKYYRKVKKRKKQ